MVSSILKSFLCAGTLVLTLAALADEKPMKRKSEPSKQENPKLLATDESAPSTDESAPSRGDAGIVEPVKEQPSSDPCAAQVRGIEKRKAWLAQRQGEQSKIGIANPAAGVANAAGLYCEKHPEDEQCKVSVPTYFYPDELTWRPDQPPMDRDPSVIGLKRELDACRQKYGTGK